MNAPYIPSDLPFREWRENAWQALPRRWDVIIIGGGITGAGLLREARRAGLNALLLEAGDFAGGTSSRSSKLVHGGFRYLRNGQIALTYQSVRERERLLKEGRSLVTPLSFLLACYSGDHVPEWVFGLGLAAYDLLALKWGHRHYPAAGLLELCPPLQGDKLRGGFRYIDAQTDDARLVLRLIREAMLDGGLALNYARVVALLRSRDGQVCGVALLDETPQGRERTVELEADVVINATGAWADELRLKLGQRRRLRKLRGSHLIFPAARLPLNRAVSFLHPSDQRPVFVLPWEGVSIIGTTDVDHRSEMEVDPVISQEEVEYLIAAARWAFPRLDLSLADVQATFAGIRPVVDTGKANPSKESREHVVWDENGLLTVTGGKLTTFRRMAHDALNRVRHRLPGRPRFDPRQRVLEPPSDEDALMDALTPSLRLRIMGRYGRDAAELIASAPANEVRPISSTPCLWAELRWAARREAVVHLDDLLLRRVRLGLLLPKGGLGLLDQIEPIVRPELGWDETRWQDEVAAYMALWKRSYSLPFPQQHPTGVR